MRDRNYFGNVIDNISAGTDIKINTDDTTIIDNMGMFVISRAGHDKGNIYIIIKEEEEYVYLADGKNRTPDNPKRKNKKHIQVIKKGASTELINKLKNHQPVYREEINHLIKTNFKI